MDPHQEIWDALRERGHALGEAYVDNGGRLWVVVDGVAMTIEDAQAVVEHRTTVEAIAARRSPDPDTPA